MKELHLVCNAHIDPVWQWEWEEGIASAFSTFSSAVKLADKYDYIFCHNEAILYKYIEEYAPELFDKIKRLVDMGKWHIMGGWYIQPDCTMPSGESFVRQIRLGKNYFKKKFNVEPKIAVNFDSFGHTRGLVQILTKTGYTGYIHCRPNSGQLQIDSQDYLWKGFDGSVIKVARRLEYSSQLGKIADKLNCSLKKDENYKSVMLGSNGDKNTAETQEYDIMFWGVGNHGGGPSDKDLAYLEKAIKEVKQPKIIHSTPETYFDKINPTFTVDKSLYIAMPGCYTTMTTVKHKHRELENLLYSTEKMASVCAFNGLMEYPEKAFENAMEDLMTAEFHDTLAGTVIEKGEENAVRLLEHGKEEVIKIRTKAFFALTENQKIAGLGEYPIFVFNYAPYNVNQTVEVEFSLADQNWSNKIGVVKVFSNGKELPCQQIKEESNLTGLDWRKKIVFDADLRALSINRFDLTVCFEERSAIGFNQELNYMDDVKSVKIDKNGLLQSYKVFGKEFINKGFGLYVYEDNADPWGMCDGYQKQVASNPKPFIPLSQTECAEFCQDKSVSSNVRVIEDGNILKRIESYFKYNNSFAKIEYTVYKNRDYIDIKVDVYNNERDKMIRLHFPTGQVCGLYGDTAFGTDELFTDGRENVSQKFIYAKQKDSVFAIINDGTYGSMFFDNTVCQSLIRSAGYCAHPLPDRPLLKDDRYTERIDQKKCTFSFRIIGLKDERIIPKLSQEFSEKPYALNIFPLGKENQYFDNIEIEDSNVILTAVKKAKDKNGFIIRLHNNSESEVKTKISVQKTSAKISFGKYEVKTLLYNDNKIEETDMDI